MISISRGRQMKALEAWGIVRPIVWWLEQSYCAVSYATLCSRMKQGWDPEKAIITPPMRKKRRGVELCLDCDACLHLNACHDAMLEVRREKEAEENV